MPHDSPRKVVTAQRMRAGEGGHADRDWLDQTPEDRIEAVWTLTQLCLHWTDQGTGVPRLHRSVVRVQRARR
jgi:hypothetical protein